MFETFEVNSFKFDKFCLNNIGEKSISLTINSSNNSLGEKLRFERIEDFTSFYNDLIASHNDLKAVPLMVGTLQLSRLIKGRNITNFELYPVLHNHKKFVQNAASETKIFKDTFSKIVLNCCFELP